jgi:hypothetical protein
MEPLEEAYYDNLTAPVINGLKQRFVQELFHKYPRFRKRLFHEIIRGFLDEITRTVEWSNLNYCKLDVSSLEAWGLEAELSQRIVGMLTTNGTNCTIQELVFWQLATMNNFVIPNEACPNQMLSNSNI